MSFVGCNIGRNGVLVNVTGQDGSAITHQCPFQARAEATAHLSASPCPRSGGLTSPPRAQGGLSCAAVEAHASVRAACRTEKPRKRCFYRLDPAARGVGYAR